MSHARATAHARGDNLRGEHLALFGAVDTELRIGVTTEELGDIRSPDDGHSLASAGVVASVGCDPHDESFQPERRG